MSTETAGALGARGGKAPDAGAPARPDRLAVVKERLGSRKALVVSLAVFGAALGGWIAYTALYPQLLWQLYDLGVYFDASNQFGHGQLRLYERNFGMGYTKMPFLYPPFAALVCRLFLPLGWAAVKILMTVGNFASMLAVVWLSLGLLGWRRGRARLNLTLLISAAVLWLEPINQTLKFGQVNMLLMLLVVLDLRLGDRVKFKGIGIGLATALKLTPGIFIVYLLITKRYRAAAVSLGVFVATILYAWARVPKTSHDFWFRAIVAQKGVGVGSLDNFSFNGFFLHLFVPHGAVRPLWALSSLAFAVPVMLAAKKAHGRGQELLAILLVAAVGLMISPISWSNHWVWVAPLMVLLVHLALKAENRWVRWSPLLVFLFMAAWPMPIDATGRIRSGFAWLPNGLTWLVTHNANWLNDVYDWNAGQFLLAESVVLVATAATVVVTWKLLRDKSEADA